MNTCYLCSDYVIYFFQYLLKISDCEKCVNSSYCLKCKTKALKSDGSKCVDNCFPEFKVFDETKVNKN